MQATRRLTLFRRILRRILRHAAPTLSSLDGEAVSESTQQIVIGHFGQVHYLADDIIENNTPTEKHLQEETIYISDNSVKLLHSHLVTYILHGKQLLGEKHRLMGSLSCFECLWVDVVICAQPSHHRSDVTVYL